MLRPEPLGILGRPDVAGDAALRSSGGNPWRTSMRRLVLAVGLLCATALPARLADQVQPPKAPPDYFRVELRGKLGVAETADGLALDVPEMAKQPAQVSVHGMRLAFGDDKDLAALAKKLDGKTVVVTGELGQWSPRTAARSPVVVSYIRVTTLKAAEDEAVRPADDPLRPKVSMADASGIAETYVRREKIDVSGKFVARVRYVDRKVVETAKAPHWEVSYEPVERSTLGGEVWVSVGMDGKCSHEFGK